jgi:hypothetical protein
MKRRQRGEGGRKGELEAGEEKE